MRTQFLRFCVVGCSNGVIDVGLLTLLLWRFPPGSAVQALLYNTLAVACASTNSFVWNKRWTFGKHTPVTRKEVGRFAALASGTTLLNDALLWGLGRAFPALMAHSLVGVGGTLLKLGAIAGTLSLSFFGMRLWVFFSRPQHARAIPFSSYQAIIRPRFTLPMW